MRGIEVFAFALVDAKTRNSSRDTLAQVRSLSLFRSFLLLPLLSLITLPARPQTQPTPIALPDSPGQVVSLAADSTSIPSNLDSQDIGDPPPSTVNPPTPLSQAPLYSMSINPNETAQKLSTKQTVVLGLKSSVSTFSVAGWFATAGWAHAINGTPNYGTDSAAFGERLGASALRGTSKGIFGNAVFAPLFHEDPRYYRMGKGNGNFGRRLWYATTRVFITRTDDGRPTPNYSLFAGNLASSALTVTYYPQRDTNVGQVGKTFGGSFIGSFIGSFNREFLPDALALAHLKHD